MKEAMGSILVVVLLMISASITYAESISCNHNYVYVGDDRTILESKCGSPDSESSRVEIRRQGGNSQAITIYTLTYNCGEYRHIKKVVVENDMIVRIYSADIGTGQNFRCENN